MTLHDKMVSAVTEHDRLQEARDRKAGRRVNIYALGIMLKACDQVEEDIKSGVEPRQAVINNFLGRLLDRVLEACGFEKATDAEHKRWR